MLTKQNKIILKTVQEAGAEYERSSSGAYSSYVSNTDPEVRQTRGLNCEEYNRNWLILAITAIALSGIFSIILVLMRTPFINELIKIDNFFKIALIIHVDLSVLIWMLSIACMLMNLIINNKYQNISKSALIIAAIGAVAIVISPFVCASIPHMNNYIPINDNLIFLIGLGLFFCGILIQSVIALINFNKDTYHIYSNSLIILVAASSFVFSSSLASNYAQNIEHYYELIFWGPGHILQFLYTQIMMIAWFTLLKIDFRAKLVKACFLINLLFVLFIPISYIYLKDEVSYLLFFTKHMRYFGGIAPFFAVILMFIYRNKLELAPYAKAAVRTSLAVFVIGGVIAIGISGVNVTIPAHYHGSIVGVSLSLMGLSYYYLEVFFARKINYKLAILQLYLYAIGQLIHITGLAWSGGYGVLRKMPGGLISSKAKISMGLMGMGGLIAIIGGFLFVYVSYKVIKNDE